MGHVEAAHVSHALPDGRVLLDDVSFRVGDGTMAALVGPNGAGKTTLIRLAAGDLVPQSGSVSSSGGLGVMRQFVGGIRDDSTVRDLLLSISPGRVREAAARLDAAELAMMERDDEPTQLRYAAALAEWGDAGGYDAEVHWDSCCTAALGVPYERCRWREVRTLSGGEQKRLVLESLLRDKTEVLLLDEPDNYLDVPGKIWLEQQLAATPKTVLLVSHDRELLANCAERIITVEDGNVWVHGGGFATYAQARLERNERLDELRRRWDEEHEKIKQLVRMYRQKASYNSDMASRLQAAVTRLRRFEEAGPPELAPRDQNVRMRLRGGRTGKRAVICENLELTGLMHAVRPRGLVQRAGGRAGLQRVRQVPLPAAARRGGRAAFRGRPARGAGGARAFRPDACAARPGGADPARDPHDHPCAAAERGHGGAGPLRVAGLRDAAVRHPVRRAAGQAADPAARAGRVDAAAARRADRQPRPGQRARPCRRAWSLTQAPWWRPRTTAGSPARSTGFWCSAPMATCMRLRSRSGTRLEWTGLAERPAC